MDRATGTPRGQTLPMWSFAVLTALTLIFFSMNYANNVRWQIRAQNAADSAAAAAMSVQANQWNKMNAVLYAADVEEWRIRHLIEGMIDAANESGGCSPSMNQCLAIYNALQAQYYKAVNRYTTEVQMMVALSSASAASQQSDATNIIKSLASSCGTATAHADCAFTYHIVDYSYRTGTTQAGKDAFYAQLGGTEFNNDADNKTPASAWEPARIEITTCATVKPLFNFSIFGASPSAFTVIGRAAATNATQTAEWLMPGQTTNPATGSPFQATETYTSQDTFASSAVPRDYYETNFPGIKYKAYTSFQQYSGTPADDFEVFLCWWAPIPLAPYSGSISESTACTQS